MIEPTRCWQGGRAEHRPDEVGNVNELYNALRAGRQRQNTTGGKTEEQKEVFLPWAVDHRRAEHNNLEGVGRSEAGLLSDELTPPIGRNRMGLVARFNRPAVSGRTRRGEGTQIDQSPRTRTCVPHGLNELVRPFGIRTQILLLCVGFGHCRKMKDGVDLRDGSRQAVSVF